MGSARPSVTVKLRHIQAHLLLDHFVAGVTHLISMTVGKTLRLVCPGVRPYTKRADSRP